MIEALGPEDIKIKIDQKVVDNAIEYINEKLQEGNSNYQGCRNIDYGPLAKLEIAERNAVIDAFSDKGWKIWITHV